MKIIGLFSLSSMYSAEMIKPFLLNLYDDLLLANMELLKPSLSEKKRLNLHSSFQNH